MLLGKGPIGRYAITAKAGGTITSGVLAIAGVATVTFVLHGFTASAMAAAGAGAFSPILHSFAQSAYSSAGAGAMAPVLHSFDGAVFSTAGSSGFSTANTRIDNRVLSISGVSTFGTFSYAFFLDAERACVHQEVTKFTCAPEPRVSVVEFDPNKNPDAIVAYVGPENRISIVPAENRVYQIGFEPRGPATPNRKRTC